MSAGQNSSSGTSRTLLLVALVAVLAVAAAVLTVVVSSRTHSPGARTVTPAIQVAAGSDHEDAEAGLVVPVPAGWRAEQGDLVFGSTALVPEPQSGPRGDGDGDDAAGTAAPGDDIGPGGVVLVGALTPDLVAAREADNQRAAAVLVSGMGEFFLPIPGRRTEQRMEEVSGRVGDGWALSYRVVGEGPDGGPIPEDAGVPAEGLVYTAVVGEGDQRYWLTYIGTPADGTVGSPGPEWADAIVERLRPSEVSPGGVDGVELPGVGRDSGIRVPDMPA